MKDYKYKILIQKRYFDEGYGITSYFKLIIALFGLSSLNVIATMIMAFAYGIGCYILGRAYIKYGWATTNIEITNKLDLFVQEMRERKI